MDKRSFVLAITLVFSTTLELWVRYVSPYVFGIDFFGIWPPIDNVMHFFWGVNVLLGTIFLLGLRPWAGFCACYLMHIGWEVTEMIGDKILPNAGYQIDHFFFDGIKDTIVFLIGSLVAWAICHYLIRKHKHSLDVVVAKSQLSMLLAMLPVAQMGFQLYVFTKIAVPTNTMIIFLFASVICIPLVAFILSVTGISRRKLSALRLDPRVLRWAAIHLLLIVPLLIYGSVVHLRGAASPDVFSTIWLISAFIVAVIVERTSRSYLIRAALSLGWS